MCCMHALYIDSQLLVIYSFDDQTNRETTVSLIRNLLGVLDSNNHYDHTVLKHKHLESLCCKVAIFHIATYLYTGAACTYFKSRKSYHPRLASGKQAAVAVSSRRRQRRHNVSNI